MACDKNMSVIIDDTIDVWRDSLPNLLLTRRFVGDPMDDGLQLLCHWLVQLHAGYYAALRPDGTPTLTTPEVLTDLRGNLLEGCVIAFTGLVADQSQEVLANQPLCALVRLYGAEVTLDVDDATHLVARKKEGWKSATKIRRALQRQEVQPPPPRPPRPPPPCLTLPSRLPVSPRHTQMQSTHPHYGFAQHPPYLGSFTPCACFVRSTPHPPPPLRQTDPSFRAVWDHWLLDSICTFKRQSEINYAVRLDEEEVEYIVPGRLDAAPAPMPPSIADDGPGCKSKGGATRGGKGAWPGAGRGHRLFRRVFFLVCSSVPSPPLACARCPSRSAGGGRLSSILGAVSKTQGQQGYPQQMRGQPGAVSELPRHAVLDSPGISLSPAVGTLPLRKRPREAEEAPPPRAENPDRARLSVADYLKSKTAPPG